MGRASRKGVQYALTALGFLLLFYLVRRLGFELLWRNLSEFGPWFLVTFAIAFAWMLFQAGAWWDVQRRFSARVPLSTLLRARIIGDSFNLILPSGNMGGDAMRAFLVKHHVPLTDGIPGVLFEKTVEFAASTVFLATALLLGLATIELPPGLIVPSAISLGATTLGIAALVAAQKRGLTAVLLAATRFAPRAQAAILRRQEPLAAMDRNLRMLYANGGRAAIGPLVLHLLARFTGGLEVMLAMAVLGAPVNIIEAWFISAVVVIGNTIFFMVPGTWGVMEGVHVLVAQSLGYPPAVGLSLSVIRRIRRLAFVGLGLALFAAGGRPQPAAADVDGIH